MVGYAMLWAIFSFVVEGTKASCALTDAIHEYRGLEAPPGSHLCALDEPSDSLSLNSVLDCALKCQRSLYCENFNYHTVSKTCDIFFNRPKCYGPSLPCIHYQVQTDQPYLGIMADECYIPFTFNKKLYYECGSNLTGEGCFNCLVHNRTIVNCLQLPDFHPILSLTNITVPTFSTSVPLMSVNRWIVVSSRIYNSINFTRTWDEYRDGFGDPTLDYWIGLEKMHQLTYSGNYRLRFEMLSTENGSWFSAEYDSILIDPESNWYTIHLDGFSGDAGDAMNKNPPAMAWQNHKKFSTYDIDNDLSSADCSEIHGGVGWWFAGCGICDLNAPFGSVSYYWKPIAQLGLGSVATLNGSRIMFRLA